MARRLSIRSRGRGSYEVGPAKHGPTVVVRALTKQGALAMAKEELQQLGKFAEAAVQSYRFYVAPDKRTMDTRTLMSV